MNKKTFLVTGATGLIGSNIVNKLLESEDVRIIALVRSESRLREMYGKYIDNGSLEYVIKDLIADFNLGSISGDAPIDVIIHAASPISRYMFKEQPVDVIKPNIIAATSLLDGLVVQKRKMGVNGRIIIFSSNAVYGMNSPIDIKIKETDTQYTEGLDGMNAAYSEAKRMTEVLAQAYVKQYGVDAVIVRPSAVYGAAFYPPEIPIYEFVNNALSGEDIHLKSSGLPKRDNIYIDDAVSAIFTILEKGKTGEAFNLGGNKENFVSYDEIAEIIAKISGEVLPNQINVIHEAPPAGSRKPGMLLDNSKLEALGWKPNIGQYEGLKETILKQKEYNAYRSQINSSTAL